MNSKPAKNRVAASEEKFRKIVEEAAAYVKVDMKVLDRAALDHLVA